MGGDRPVVPLPEGGNNPPPSRVARFRLETLKQRRLFQEAQGGPRYSTAHFTMLRRPGVADATGRTGPRFGFTVTKKLGGAVLRNRIRRRLRAAVRAAAAELPEKPLDFVIIARSDALMADFAKLVGEIARAVRVLAERDRSKPPRPARHG